MGFIQSAHDQIGLAFSIIGLTLVVPTVFLFKQYNRFLDHLQVIFLFSTILTPSYETFGSHLDESWVKFIPNFLKFCTAGDIVCELGFALSWTICLVGVIFLLFVIVTFQKCRKPDLHFQPVYSFFKGFFKWTYIPLVFYSLSQLIIDIKSGSKQNFIASIVILAWTIVFPVAQLIVYKIIQRQKDIIWIKWFQFLGYVRQFSIVLILVFSVYVQTSTSIAKYFVYGPLILYCGIYLWKGIYIYRILERVFFGLQEAIMITIFSLYLFDPLHLAEYQLDFIGLAVILLMQLTLIIIKLITWLVYGKIDEPKVTPSENFQDKNKGNNSFEVLDFSNDFVSKKKNKYEESDDLLGSRESLAQSIRKGNQRRRR